MSGSNSDTSGPVKWVIGIGLIVGLAYLIYRVFNHGQGGSFGFGTSGTNGNGGIFDSLEKKAEKVGGEILNLFHIVSVDNLVNELIIADSAARNMMQPGTFDSRITGPIGQINQLADGNFVTVVERWKAMSNYARLNQSWLFQRHSGDMETVEFFNRAYQLNIK